MKQILFSIFLLLLVTSSLHAEAIKKIEIGYSGLFRPSEWTPVEIELSPEFADKELSISVNNQFFFKRKANGNIFRPWLLLPKTSSNHIRITSGETLLFSSLDANNKQPLHLQAIPATHRVVGVLLNANAPFATSGPEQETLLKHRIHVVKLTEAMLRAAPEFLESIDHIITNEQAETKLSKQARQTLDNWIASGGTRTSIDKRQGNRKEFVAWLCAFEDNRTLRANHTSALQNENAYDLFDWPPFPSSLRKSILLSSGACMIFLLLFMWSLPPKPVQSSVVMALFSLSSILAIVFIIPRVSHYNERLFLLTDEASIIRVDEMTTRREHFTSVTAKRKNRTLPQTHGSALKALVYGSSDQKKVHYQWQEEGGYQFANETLSPGRRHLYAELSHEQSGPLSGSIRGRTFEIKNQTGLNFKDVYVIAYGKSYRAGTLNNGDILFGQTDDKKSQSITSSFDSQAQDAKIEKQVLTYWKTYYMNPNRVYCLMVNRETRSNDAGKNGRTKSINLWYSELKNQ